MSHQKLKYDKNNPPTVYSYIRFSTPEQLKGNSLKRQMDYAVEWSAKNNLHLDTTLNLKDLGVSAYKQGNIKKGALGQFLRLVEDGVIKEGSILIVEDLDRISRDKPVLAQGLFISIIQMGITIVTATDNKAFNEESISESPMDFIFSFLKFVRSHEESETKSKRVNNAIKSTCLAWINGSKREHIRQGRTPFWIKETGKPYPNLYELKEDEAEIIRYAIGLHKQGYGGSLIQQTLINEGLNEKLNNGKGVSLAHWNQMFSRPTLCGTKIVTTSTDTFEIEDYYPAVISKNEYNELQAIRKTRSTIDQRAIKASKTVHLFTGIKIAKCGYCGYHLGSRAYTSKRNNKYYTFIGCGANRNGGCVKPKHFNTTFLDKAILEYCRDKMTLNQMVIRPDKNNKTQAKLEGLMAKLEKINSKLSKLTEVLIDSDEPPQTIIDKMKELESDKKALQPEIARLKGVITSQSSVSGKKILKEWKELSSKALDNDYEARLELKVLVSRTFKSIHIFTESVSAARDNQLSRAKIKILSQVFNDLMPLEKNAIDVIVNFTTGGTRLLRINSKTGEWKSCADIG